MKKAKRLLAILLAVVMIFSASCVSVYATTMDNDYHTPGDNNGKYWFTYEQGCGYVCDIIDELLGSLNIWISNEELNDMTISGLYGTLLNLDGYMKNNGIPTDDTNGDGYGDNYVIDLTSLDDAIPVLYSVVECVHDNGLVSVIDAIAGAFGDLLDGTKGLPELDDAAMTLRRSYTTVNDRQVLEFLISYVCDLKTMLSYILIGDFDWGLLGDMLPAEIQDIPGTLKTLLYNMLVDENADAAPSDFSIDAGVQQLLNWALITGTGDGSNTDTTKTHATFGDGASSLLGPNAEPLLPALGDQPGGASIFGETISVDRDGDGVYETATMSFYQLVSNVIEAFMGGTVSDMLRDMLFDMLDVEITEELPYGDPALVNDQTFSMIVGIVVDLLTANGAPDMVYETLEIDTDGDGVTEEVNEADYPVTKVEALMDWLFVDGALDAFIKIDYYGFHIQDNFMSLLNDISRLLINLLPALGLFESSSHLAYTSDDLNRTWYLDADYNIVAPEDETKDQQTYLTYEAGEVIYATEFVDINGALTPSAYCYLSDKSSVNTTDATLDTYRNPDLVRPNYVINQDMVWANIIKLALNDFIDGCYFPEWTEDIPSVLAYGFAALAAPTLPENNYFERLDAYHEATVTGTGVSLTYSDDEMLPYTTMKVVDGESIEVPYAALCIIASYLADDLNGTLMLGANRLTTDTTLEQFACEFFGWALYTYMPMFIGRNVDNSSATFANGTWSDATLVFINEVFGGSQTDFASITCAETANFDAIYDLFDATLFSLLPTSWLPNITGSNMLINGTILSNLINFDLQGILDLFTVNTSADAELNLPVVTVLLRIIDRVLAIVFNDNGLLLPAGRTNVVKTQNLTTITSLDALLDCSSLTASLPSLVGALLDNLKAYHVPILATVFPLLVSSVYERPFDEEYLTGNGRDKATYKIADLEGYAHTFDQNINATLYATIENTYVPVDKDGQELGISAADFAYDAVDGKAKAEKTADGSAMNVILSNNAVYGTYATLAEAQEVINILKNSYIFEELVDEETETYKYHIYNRRSYFESATGTAASYADGAGDYTKYSDFTFAQMTYRSTSPDNPVVYYDSDYRYFAYEDLSCFSAAGFAYDNAKTALEDAYSYVSEYESFIENDLPDAYGEWLMYSVRTRLRTGDLYDANDDGYSVLSTSDSDYVAETTGTDADGNTIVTDDGNPVDGDPDIPTAMYPFYTTAANNFQYIDNAHNLYYGWFDTASGNIITGITTDYFTAANFEQIASAVAYGADSKNDVTLSDEDAEAVVRLALGSLAFDITPNNGAYNAGSAQWATLTDAQKTTISNWCTTNGFTYVEETLEDGTVAYAIKRSAFKLLDSSYPISVTNVSATPILALSDINARRHESLVSSDTYTYDDEVVIQLNSSYNAYVEAIYANRESLYNAADTISYRFEQLETLRSSKIDTTLLKWLRALVEDDYKNPQTKKLNVAYKMDETTGQPVFDENGNKIEIKAFTATSYAKFRDAYDFVNSLIEAAEDANVSGSGITQSMATEAFYGLLEAWQNLIEFTGFADWTQLNSLMTVAYSIINDPYVDDPTFGVAEGLENLIIAYEDALTLKADEANIDEERQGEIDATASALNSALTRIKYNLVPQIVADPEATTSAEIQQTEYKGSIQYAHVYALEEGVGFGDLSDAEAAIEALGLKIAGMTIDGTNYTVAGGSSERGVGGTGAMIAGYYQGNTRFEYYAVLYGDLNGDARIDGTDANYLAVQIAKDQVNASAMLDWRYEAADPNHDGAPDASDIQAIRDHYLLVDTIAQDQHNLETE